MLLTWLSIHSYKPHWASLYTWQYAAPIRHVARSNRCIRQQSGAVVHTCSNLQYLASNGYRRWDSLAGSVSRSALCPSSLATLLAEEMYVVTRNFFMLRLCESSCSYLSVRSYRQFSVNPQLKNKGRCKPLTIVTSSYTNPSVRNTIPHIHALNNAQNRWDIALRLTGGQRPQATNQRQ